MLTFIILLILSYLIGSIPTAVIAGKLLKNIDIRVHGSGNAGATNVLRVLGWKAALIVLLIDMLKGFIAAYWFARLMPENQNLNIYALYQILFGMASICGHIWSVFVSFKGGKGVGTAAGVFLGLQPLPVLICLIVFSGIVSRTRYVSLGSMTAAILLPIILLVEFFFLGRAIPVPHIIIALLLAAIIIWTHRENIQRLTNGTENKISFKKGENK